MSWTNRIATGIGMAASVFTADHFRFQSLKKDASHAVCKNLLFLSESLSSDPNTLFVKVFRTSWSEDQPAELIATMMLERKVSWIDSRIKNVEYISGHFPTVGPILYYLNYSPLISFFIKQDVSDSHMQYLHQASDVMALPKLY